MLDLVELRKSLGKKREILEEKQKRKNILESFKRGKEDF